MPDQDPLKSYSPMPKKSRKSRQQDHVIDVGAALAKHAHDPSLWAIIIGNIISIALAITQNWELGQLLWVYWAQSVIIGIINVIRMLTLKEFSTKGMRMNGNAVPETTAAKMQVAFFFTIHYGFFHAIYAAFLWQRLPLTDIDTLGSIGLAIAISAFVGSHSYSFLHNLSRDFKEQKPNLGTIMFYPYLRIIPMHLTIIFGGMIESLGLMIFMVLKTFADAGTHMVEHHLFQKPDKSDDLRMKD